MDFEYIRNHKTVRLQRLVGPTLSPRAILSIDAGAGGRLGVGAPGVPDI